MVFISFLVIFFISWSLGLNIALWLDLSDRLETKFALHIHALAIGLFSFFAILLSITHFGVMLTPALIALSSFILVCSLISYKNIKNLIQSSPHSYPFTLPLFFIFLYATFLVILKSTYFFPSWDHFTYWLVDAKEIYLHNRLRIANDVNNYFDYTSFVPLQFATFYQLLGSIKEEATGLFSVFYLSLCSLLIISSHTSKRHLLNLAIAFICLCIFASLWNLSVISYAEAFTIFCFTLFFSVLRIPSSSEWQGKKIALLITIALGIAFIKGPFKIYTVFLIPFIILAERSFFKNRRLKFNAWFLFPIFLLSSHFFYRSFIWDYSITIPLIDEKRALNGSLLDRIKYIEETLLFLFNEHSLMFSFYLFAFVYAVFRWKSVLPISRMYLAALFIFPGINIGYYVLEMTSHQSHSLGRYVTPTFFVLGIFIAHELVQNFSKVSKKGLAVFACIVFGLFIHQVKSTHHEIRGLNFHDWRMSSNPSFSDSVRLQDQVASQISKNSRILILGDIDESISNMGFNCLVHRYFLLSHTVGGLFRLPLHRMQEKFRETKPDYIVISDFIKKGPTLKFLNMELDELDSYLIKVNSIDPLTLGTPVKIGKP